MLRAMPHCDEYRGVVRPMIMKWRLFFQDNNSVPVGRQWGDYDSKEAALRAACGMIKVARVSVLYIENPDGNEIGAAMIREWCDAQSKTA